MYIPRAHLLVHSVEAGEEAIRRRSDAASDDAVKRGKTWLGEPIPEDGGGRRRVEEGGKQALRALTHCYYVGGGMGGRVLLLCDMTEKEGRRNGVVVDLSTTKQASNSSRRTSHRKTVGSMRMEAIMGDATEEAKRCRNTTCISLKKVHVLCV